MVTNTTAQLCAHFPVTRWLSVNMDPASGAESSAMMTECKIGPASGTHFGQWETGLRASGLPGCRNLVGRGASWREIQVLIH